MDTFGSGKFVKNIYRWGKSSAVIFYRINKARFISFFVYKGQSRNRFYNLQQNMPFDKIHFYKSHLFILNIYATENIEREREKTRK